MLGRMGRKLAGLVEDKEIKIGRMLILRTKSGMKTSNFIA